MNLNWTWKKKSEPEENLKTQNRRGASHHLRKKFKKYIEKNYVNQNFRSFDKRQLETQVKVELRVWNF